jgi:outer membrane lipoprotein SlyB
MFKDLGAAVGGTMVGGTAVGNARGAAVATVLTGAAVAGAAVGAAQPNIPRVINTKTIVRLKSLFPKLFTLFLLA